MTAKLISDGTPAGTRLEIDGVPLKGVTFVGWELGSTAKHGTVRLEIRDVEVEIIQASRRQEAT